MSLDADRLGRLGSLRVLFNPEMAVIFFVGLLKFFELRFAGFVGDEIDLVVGFLVKLLGFGVNSKGRHQRRNVLVGPADQD